MNQLGSKIKIISVICFTILALAALFMLLSSIADYILYAGFSFSPEYSAALSQILKSLGLIWVSIISFFCTYGFGQLVENSDFIVSHLKNSDNQENSQPCLNVSDNPSEI